MEFYKTDKTNIDWAKRALRSSSNAQSEAWAIMQYPQLSKQTMNILKEICTKRLLAVNEAKKHISLDNIKKQIENRSIRHISDKLRSSSKPCIIAETKKASPSAGIICKNYNAADIAKGYEEAGASAISVLTEPEYFMGSDIDLKDVRKKVAIPVLRKDFIVDEYQVYETAFLGADIILLICACLDKQQLESFYQTAIDLDLDVLVEVHTKQELDLALCLHKAIIGVNNRNLKTLSTDIQTAIDLSQYIPKGRLSVAESGIKTKKDIEKLHMAGYKGFLIGEALLKQNPSDALRNILI